MNERNLRICLAEHLLSIEDHHLFLSENFTLDNLKFNDFDSCHIPISAELTSFPSNVQIDRLQVGGGPVFAIVPDVVIIDTLNPSDITLSPVLYMHLI